MKIIHLHGPLGEKYGKKHKLAVRDAAEAIRALSCLYEFQGFKSDFGSFDEYHVFYGSRKNPLELDEDTFLVDYDETNLHFVPIIAGGSRKRGLGKVLASVAIFALSFAVPGSGPLAAAVVNTMRSVAASMFFTGVGMLLSPQIKPSDSGVSDQNYLFNNVDGTVGRGNPVPLVYGECLATGYAISQDIDTSYIVPPSPNYTPPNFSGGQFNWQGSYYDVIGAGGGKSGGGGGGTESPNTLTTVSRARVLDLYSEGPIEGFSDSDPAKSIYLQGVPLRGSDDNFNFEGVSFSYRAGLPDQDFVPGFESTATPMAVSEQPVLASNASGVVFGGNKNASGPDAVKVTIAISELFRLDSQTGNLGGTNLSFAIDRSFNGSAYTTIVTENLVNEKTTSRYERDYRIDLPAGTGNYNIRIRKLTADPAPGQESTLKNSLLLARAFEIRDVKLSYRNSAVVGMEFDAKQFGTNIPARQAKLKGIKVWVPQNYNPVTRQYATSGTGTSNGTWDGTFKLAWTDNPAWILYDLMVNDRYGLGQEYWRVLNSIEYAAGPTNAIPDKWSLYSIAQRCDELVFSGDGVTQEPRYRIGIQITSRQEAYQLLQSIAAVFQGMLYYADGQVITVADRPQPDEFFLNQTDVIDGIFDRQTVSRKALFSTALVYWNDPNNLDKREVEVVDDPELYVELGDKPTDIQLFGCRSKIQARRHGRWFLRTQQTQGEVISCVASMKASVLFPGMVGRIFDPHYAGVRYSGRVVASDPNPVVPEDNTRRLIVIDTPNLTVPIGTQMYTELLGNFAIYTVESFATNANNTFLGVVGGGANGILVGADYGINLANASGQRVRIISVKQEDNGFMLDMIPYDANKYMYIDQFVDLPDEQTSIIRDRKPSPVLSVVASDYYIRRQGSEPIPCLSVTYRPNTETISSLSRYQVEVTQNGNPYALKYEGTDNAITIENLQFDYNNTTKVRVRVIDVLGRFSDWVETSPFSMDGIDGLDSLLPPQNITSTTAVNSIVLRWTKPPNADYKHVEIWVTPPGVGQTETLVAEVEPNTYTFTAEADGTYAFRLRTVLHTQVKDTNPPFNLLNRRSAFSSVVNGSRRLASKNDISVTLPDLDPTNWTKFINIEAEVQTARRNFSNLTKSIEDARDTAILQQYTELGLQNTSGPNLVGNGHFRTDTQGWAASLGTFERVVEGDRFFVRPTQASSGAVQFFTNPFRVEAGQTYNAAAWIRANTGSRLRFMVFYYSDVAATSFLSFEFLANVTGSTANNTWTRYVRSDLQTTDTPRVQGAPVVVPVGAVSARIFVDNQPSPFGNDCGISDIVFNKGNRLSDVARIFTSVDTDARITTLNTTLTSQIGAVATSASNLTAQMSRQSPNIHLNSLFERSPTRTRSFVDPPGSTPQNIIEPDPTRLGQLGFALNFIANATSPSISRQGNPGQYRMRMAWTGAASGTQLVMNIGQDSPSIVRRILPNQRYAFGIRVVESTGNASHLAPSIWWQRADGTFYFTSNSAISGVNTFSTAGGSAWISGVSPADAVAVRLFIDAFKSSTGATGAGSIDFDLPFFGPIPSDATAAPTWVPGEDSTSTAIIDNLNSVAVTAREAGAYSKNSIEAALSSPTGTLYSNLKARFDNEVILTVVNGPEAGNVRTAAFMANSLSTHIDTALGVLGATASQQRTALSDAKTQAAASADILTATALGAKSASVEDRRQALTDATTSAANFQLALNSVFKGSSATVATKAQAIADAANRSSAAWVTTVSAGGSTATLALTAVDNLGNSYSTINFKADNIEATATNTVTLTGRTIRLANTAGTTIIDVLTLNNGFAYFNNPITIDTGSKRTIVGGNLPLWVGSTSQNPNTATVANGSLALDANGILYRDGVEVYQKNQVINEINTRIAAIIGGYMDPAIINLTTANGNGAGATFTAQATGGTNLQYSWSQLSGDTFTTLSANGKNCTVSYSGLGAGDSRTGVLKCVVTNTEGGSLTLTGTHILTDTR